MESLLTLETTPRTIEKDVLRNLKFTGHKRPSLTDKCHVFLLGNSNELGKKEVFPIFFIDFALDDKIIPALKAFAHTGTNIRRVYFTGEKFPAINVKRKDVIMAFSLSRLAHKGKIPPLASKKNAEALKYLIRIGQKWKNAGAIIHFPN